MTNNNQSVKAIDQMDQGMDMLETVWLALQAKGWIDDAAIENISGSILTVISTLKPVRSALNRVEVDITI